MCPKMAQGCAKMTQIVRITGFMEYSVLSHYPECIAPTATRPCASDGVAPTFLSLHRFPKHAMQQEWKYKYHTKEWWSTSLDQFGIAGRRSLSDHRAQLPNLRAGRRAPATPAKQDMLDASGSDLLMREIEKLRRRLPRKTTPIDQLTAWRRRTGFSGNSSPNNSNTRRLIRI